jgi:hypothetical protein
VIELIRQVLGDFVAMVSHPKQYDGRADQAARMQWQVTRKEAKALLERLDGLEIDRRHEYETLWSENVELRDVLRELYGVAHHRYECDKGIPKDGKGDLAETCMCGMRQAIDRAKPWVHQLHGVAEPTGICCPSSSQCSCDCHKDKASG